MLEEEEETETSTSRGVKVGETRALVHGVVLVVVDGGLVACTPLCLVHKLLAHIFAVLVILRVRRVGHDTLG